MRAMKPICTAASVNAGIAMLCHQPTKLWVSGTKSPAGNQCSRTAKAKIIIRPNQNSGTDSPTSASTMIDWSVQVACRIAASRPATTPITVANTNASAGQRQRHRQPFDNRGGNASVQQDRLAEIAVQDAAVPGDHLQVERLIQAEPMPHLGELLRRRTGVEEHRRGIARHQPDHRERHQRHQKQHRDRDQQPPDDEARHQRRTGVCIRSPAMSPTGAGCDMARSS